MTKYANKYETPEQLESAYNANVGEAMKIKGERDQLAAELSKFKAPDNYLLPAGVTLDEKDSGLLVDLAKKGGLSQDQFAKIASETAAMTQTLTKAQQEAQATAQKNRTEKLSKYDKLELDSTVKFFEDEFGDMAKPLIDRIDDDSVFNKLKGVKQKMTTNALPGMNTPYQAPRVDDMNAIPEIKKQFAELMTKLDSDPMNSEDYKRQMTALATRQTAIMDANKEKTA